MQKVSYKHNMIIYKITNQINNKAYIGQTIGKFEKRINAHCSNNIKNRSAINRAIKKYGKINFKFEVIFSTRNIQDLNWAEEYFIDYYNTLCPNGYNLIKGGNNRQFSEEAKRILSESHKHQKNENLKGVPKTEEHKRKLSIAKKQDPKNRERMLYALSFRKPRINFKHSEETKKYISEIQKGKVRYQTAKKIILINKLTDIQIGFRSITDCQKFLNVTRHQIFDLTQNEGPLTKQYMVSYISE